LPNSNVLDIRNSVDFSEALDIYGGYLQGASLTRWISERESALDLQTLSSGALPALEAAFELKRSVSELNTFIHAVGIIASLPHLLRSGEVIESVSLGAGNTGKDFDLETNLRVAEFKFITWKGNDAVRQDSLFADLVKLCLHPSDKQKFLYLTGADLALRFLEGRRAIESVLSRRAKILAAFHNRFASGFKTVGEFYRCDFNCVRLVDLHDVVPGLRQIIAGVLRTKT
jgi:hypothetical protein